MAKCFWKDLQIQIVHAKVPCCKFSRCSALLRACDKTLNIIWLGYVNLHKTCSCAQPWVTLLVHLLLQSWDVSTS